MSRFVLLALACLPFLAAPALAHEVRPGYLARIIHEGDSQESQRTDSD